jgi:brefeldin A-inhibited guanine nucleotide-exchange protein
LLFLLDGVLDLLFTCMTHENQTLSRIGSTCLQQLVVKNIHKMDSKTMDKVCQLLIKLFWDTAPTRIFFNVPEAVGQRHPAVPYLAYPLGDPPLQVDFHHITTKCVLHVLVVQTVAELLGTPGMYEAFSTRHLLELMECLDHSRRFAMLFNDDLELRTALFRMRFMTVLPNLNKQETFSVSCFLTITGRMYLDEGRRGDWPRVEALFVPYVLWWCTFCFVWVIHG